MTAARPPLWRIVIAYATEILILAACAITAAVTWQYIGFWAVVIVFLVTIPLASITAFHLSRWAAS